MRFMVMDSSVKIFDQDVKVTISIGISTYPNEKVMSGDQLIKFEIGRASCRERV